MAGSALKLPALSLCSLPRTMRSAMRQPAHSFAPAKFAFWMRAGVSNAQLHSTSRIENCDAQRYALLIGHDCLRCRFAQFELRIHFLQSFRKRLNLLLLFREAGLKPLLLLGNC